MSSNFPSGGPSGPPPPAPGSGQPDYLEAGPAGRAEPAPRARGKRIAAIGGGAALLALVGGGVWAWNAWFDQGPQPAEALPADTLAYVSIDLDPSGEQKVEAMQTLDKFPGIEEELDFDLGTKDDVKEWIFESLQRAEGVCAELDYGSDVKPWLGDRFAFAVVDRDEHDPVPVVVAQVTDENEAADGLEKLFDCVGAAGDDELGGYAIDGDWALLAESEDIATEVLDAADDAPLSEDADYEKWTEAAGEPGIMTMYAAPEAGHALLDYVPANLFGGTASVCEATPFPEPEYSGEQGDGGFEDYDEESLESCDEYDPEPAEVPDEIRDLLEQFEGMAVTLRFDSGDVELELATGETALSGSAFFADGGPDLLTTLPDSTAAAFGAGLSEDWVDVLVDQLDTTFGGEMSGEDALDLFEQEVGLSRADLEALGGTSFAIAFDSEVDPSAFTDEDITRVPVGAKLTGDSDAIEAALTELKSAAGDDLAQLVWETDGDYVLVSANPAYLDVLASDGDLGDDAAFRDLAPGADDARTVFFVNLDANDWLDDLLADTGAPAEVTENVEPLQGLGFTTWVEDDQEHALLRLTTE